MRKLAPFAIVCLLGAVAVAQPAGSADSAGSSGSAGSADTPSSTGSAATTPPPSPPPPPAPAADASAADKRKICAEAMNADPSFAIAIVETVNKKTAEEHVKAAGKIAKNEKHVVLAYAAMWVIAALFVLFLWRRQQLLKTEIATLRRDLDAATKDSK